MGVNNNLNRLPHELLVSALAHVDPSDTSNFSCVLRDLRGFMRKHERIVAKERMYVNGMLEIAASYGFHDVVRRLLDREDKTFDEYALNQALLCASEYVTCGFEGRPCWRSTPPSDCARLCGITTEKQ